MDDTSNNTDNSTNSTNVNVLSATVLNTPATVKARQPLTSPEQVVAWRRSIVDILAGRDRRLLVIVGPCSVHDPVAVQEYAKRLAVLQKRCPKLFLVMRTYFEKPRTRKGWSGFLHDPHLDGSCDMQLGVEQTRGLLISIVAAGVPCATETLSLLAPQYFDDLIAFACIGARTTESQPHRELASGLSVPVGFKNSTSGSVVAALNGIVSASEPKSFMGMNENGHAAVIRTSGNPHCCLVLRGGEQPNYRRADVQRCVDEMGEVYAGIVVDASHGNSGKDWQEQIRVVEYLAKNRHSAVRGIMVESFLCDGQQSIHDLPLTYGVSVTDSCIGWHTTQRLLVDLNASVLG
tara:strand:+ start:2145 stop:3188 length:1044 start_codon:yes stop_codon:yes gene_type:complete